MDPSGAVSLVEELTLQSSIQGRVLGESALWFVLLKQYFSQRKTV